MTTVAGLVRPRRELTDQGARFVAVGVINTIFGYGLFALLVLALGDSIPYLALLLMAHVVSVVEAYVLQRRFVFRVQGRWFKDLARFWSVYLVALVLNVIVLPLLVEVLGLPVLLAQALFLAVMTLGTFVTHRTWTFRRPSAASDDGRNPR